MGIVTEYIVEACLNKKRTHIWCSVEASIADYGIDNIDQFWVELPDNWEEPDGPVNVYERLVNCLQREGLYWTHICKLPLLSSAKVDMRAIADKEDDGVELGEKIVMYGKSIDYKLSFEDKEVLSVFNDFGEIKSHYGGPDLGMFDELVTIMYYKLCYRFKGIRKEPPIDGEKSKVFVGEFVGFDDGASLLKEIDCGHLVSGDSDNNNEKENG